MRRRLLTTVALSLLLVLAGCTGGAGSGAGPATTATATPPTAQASASSGGDQTTGTPTPTTTKGTPTATYVAQKPPNTPTATAEPNRNRIVNAKFINKVKSADGQGYSNFDIRMLANTSMARIDPKNVTGDVEGEPYAIVLINGKLVERTDYLEMKDRGRYDIRVRMAAFEHKDIGPGTLRVKVLLMDQDKDRGDVYGTWTGTIEYRK